MARGKRKQGCCHRASHFESLRSHKKPHHCLTDEQTLAQRGPWTHPMVRTYGVRFPREHLSPTIPKTFAGIMNARGKFSGNPTTAPYFDKSHHFLSSANVQNLKNSFNKSRRNRRLRPCSVSQLKGAQDKYPQTRGR